MISLYFNHTECGNALKALENWGYVRKIACCDLIEKFKAAREARGGHVEFRPHELTLIFRIALTAGSRKKPQAHKMGKRKPKNDYPANAIRIA